MANNHYDDSRSIHSLFEHQPTAYATWKLATSNQNLSVRLNKRYAAKLFHLFSSNPGLVSYSYISSFAAVAPSILDAFLSTTYFLKEYSRKEPIP
jgi:hypothetical protein